MYQFIETICCEMGRFQNIGLHNERFNRTQNFFFGICSDFHLESILSVPGDLKTDHVKCKVTYANEIISTEFEPYKIRQVKSLQLVTNDTIDYAYKYADRSKLDSLYKLRGQCGDILIVKKGVITDTSFANIVFKKEDRWYSPQNPLLRGTRLESYIRKGIVTPAILCPEDLSNFSEARIINAMVSIENSFPISIGNIYV